MSSQESAYYKFCAILQLNFKLWMNCSAFSYGLIQNVLLNSPYIHLTLITSHLNIISKHGYKFTATV